MEFTIGNVTVKNWSKDPFGSLNDLDKRRLKTSIIYSRQIVDDACKLLREYRTKQMVKAADRQMAKDYFGTQAAAKEALRKYFGLDLGNPASLGTVTTIIDKFSLIKNGIDAPFEIVVGAIHDGDDITEGLRDAFALMRRGKPKHAWGEIKRIRTGTEGWVHPGPTHALHRIHLNTNVVKTYSEGKIARVIVHEASHKFANTIDDSFTDLNGDDRSGYKWDDLKYNQAGYSNLHNNADSYAWGGRLMWKRKRNLQSGV